MKNINKPTRVFFDNQTDTSIEPRHVGLPSTYINTPETFPLETIDVIKNIENHDTFDVVLRINQEEYMANHTDPSGCKHKNHFLNRIFRKPDDFLYQENAILGVNQDDFIVKVNVRYYNQP